jgi:hypothetical protein
LGLLCLEVMRGGVPFYEDSFALGIISDSGIDQSHSSGRVAGTSNSDSSSAHLVLNNLPLVQSKIRNTAVKYANTGLSLWVTTSALLLLRSLFERALEYDPADRAGSVSMVPLKHGTL